MNDSSNFVIDVLLGAINSPTATNEQIAYIAMILNSPGESPWETDSQTIDFLTEVYIAYTHGFDYQKYSLKFRSKEELIINAQPLKAAKVI